MGFLLFPIYGLLMGLRLAALGAAGAPLIDTSLPNASLSVNSTLLVVHDRITALKLFLGSADMGEQVLAVLAFNF